MGSQAALGNQKIKEQRRLNWRLALAEQSPRRLLIRMLEKPGLSCTICGMERFRFSLAGLMGLVLLSAVAMAALKSANKLWADLITTFVLGALLIAKIGRASCRERV